MNTLASYSTCRFARRFWTGWSGARKTPHGVRLAIRPWLDFLEERITPAGSITIANAYLVNGSNQPISSISAGEDIFVHADFTTLNLPSNASYQVAYNVNGFTLDSPTVSYGAGTSGSGSWYYYRGDFIATPGINQVSVTINPQSTYSANTFSFSFSAASPPVGYLTYSVAQIRSAYGINSIPSYGPNAADGTGQTIAIVDAYNDPSILTDLDGFDQAMQLTPTSTESLYQQYGLASSILTVYNQNGVNITSQIHNSGQGPVPPVDSTGSWEGEETMDVEWAHAIAPGAKIDLIETDGSGAFDDLFAGAKTAGSLPGVTVVSMS
jgi:subtilase family serine protease